MDTVAVVGLGYVGLPLALGFGRAVRTIGLDIDEGRIAILSSGHDPMRESPVEAFAAARQLEFTSDPRRIRHANVVIITVPTPVNEAKQPDLGPLRAAGLAVGRNLRPGAIVVLESTVYPGLTEEWLGPLLEAESGMQRGRDFRLAYSPERINPGDREHSLRNTIKVVSGEDQDTLDVIAALYETVVDAGVFKAKSIRVAEAAKVIENTQRDLNIALMNELAIIFHKLGIDTLDVLETAGTKWNFLPFRPGLVGGHCIGVDPYYLTYKAEVVGYHPEVILAGRRINDNFGRYVASRTIKAMIADGFLVQGVRVAVLGVAFKENCPDTRNSRVFDLIRELEEYGIEVVAVDPVVDHSEVLQQHGISLQSLQQTVGVAAVVFAVAHDEFDAIDSVMMASWAASGVRRIVDVKGRLDSDAVRACGIHIERL